ncbi:MAG: hypothetical protein LBE09_01390 [Christensenellaceae bacterium]|jgi:hypothetical protein|nr:hypothetical protein [Christensenellaceae bacterium]
MLKDNKPTELIPGIPHKILKLDEAPIFDDMSDDPDFFEDLDPETCYTFEIDDTGENAGSAAIFNKMILDQFFNPQKRR